MEEAIIAKVYRAGLKFLEPLTAEETYKTIVDEAVKLVGADYSAILLEENGELKKTYASSEFGYQIKNRKRGNTYKAFKTGKPLIAHISDLEKAHPLMRERGLKSSIFIPLSYHKKTLGVLTVHSFKDEKFTGKELRTLALFGSQAILAIRKTQLYEETKKALEVRDIFISMASHELRTPLTSLNGYVQLLEAKKNNFGAQEANWIEQLSRETKRLTNLIKELLELNKIKSGQLEYYWKECHLKEIIDRVTNNFKFSHPTRNLVFIDNLKDGQDMIIGDFDKLIQVFTNLIDNAIKFSDSGSSVLLRLKKNNNTLVVSFEDKGKGVTKKDLPRVFEEFYKGPDHLKEGVGLGLFICKTIIVSHNGMIKINTKLNQGTKVEVSLPRVKI